MNEEYAFVTKPGENTVHELKTAEELKDYQEKFNSGFHLTDKEAEIILGYMEGHGYMLGENQGLIYRGDLAETVGMICWEDFSMDDAIDLVCEWNYELILEADALRNNPTDFIDFSKLQNRYESLKADELVMDEDHEMNEKETSRLMEDRQIIENVTLTPKDEGEVTEEQRIAEEKRIDEEKRIIEEQRIAEEKRITEEQKDTDNGDTTTDFDVSSIHDNNLKDLEILNRTEYYLLEVKYDDKNQYVKSIIGKFSDIPVWDSEDALRSLYSVKTLVGLDDPASQLVLDMEDESESGKAYTFNQYHENIEVFGSTITVSVDNEGKALSLRSWIISNEVLRKSITTTSPKLSESEINQIIQKTYPDTIDMLSSLCIFTMEDDDNPILVYMTYTLNENQMSYIIILDANSGEVIFEDIAMNID